MKKVHYSFLLVLIIVFVSYRVRTMDAPSGAYALGGAAAFTLGYEEAMKMYAQHSKTLEDYSRHNKGVQINTHLVEAFLNKQIHESGLNSKNFHYYVGNAWLIFPLANNTYGFIIPSDDPSLVGSTVWMMNQPASRLNIVHLNRFLRHREAASSSLYDEYRLQVIKTLIEAQFEGVLSVAASSKLGSVELYTSDIADRAISSALSILSAYMARFSTWLGYAVTGSSLLYGQGTSVQKAGFLQMAIDEYVIKSNDRGLLRARIEDLKGQLKAEKQGFAYSKLSFINQYMPSSLQWGELGYTAKVLNLLEDLERGLGKSDKCV